MSDLYQVIEDSITDSELPDEPEVAETPDTDSTETVVEAPAEPESDAEPVAPEPAASTPEPPVPDEYEKRFGTPEVAGRENRIPYSRVKRITEKAVNDLAAVVLGRNLNAGEKALDVVKAHVAQFPVLQEQNAAYAERLEQVGKFENMMLEEPKTFLQQLAKVPAYAGFFKAVGEAFAARSATPAQPEAKIASATPATPEPIISEMPEPDQELSDGSMVYSMDGLKALLAWQSKETESRVIRQMEERYEPKLHQIEERYKPLEDDHLAEQHIKNAIPVVRAQIADAQTWPLFNENESEIVAALVADPNLQLDAAYRKIVYPKLAVDRDKMRQTLLNEIKAAPTATSMTGTSRSSAVPTAAGPRTLEQIIADEVAKIK